MILHHITGVNVAFESGVLNLKEPLTHQRREDVDLHEIAYIDLYE